MPSKCASLQQRGNPVQRNCLHFFKYFKTVPLYGLMKKYKKSKCKNTKTKLTSGNVFIVDLFALGSEKETKYDQRTIFWGATRSFDLSFKP